MKQHERQRLSNISNKYPTFRDIAGKTGMKWLDGKRIDDGAEGLWRIHDTLYDLTDFIQRHPGGPDWLTLTKGTDITEAFEAHHITQNAEMLLPKFKVREAKEPRNFKFTFKDDGFYRTLKRRVREKLPEIDKSPIAKTRLIFDSLLTLTFVGAILTAYSQNYLLGALSAVILTWTVISAHNYFHTRDNWRMVMFNLSFMSYREWRISHALSHHIYTNSLHDLEISMFEPFFCWLPDPKIKNWIQRYGSWVYGPLIYVSLYFFELTKRVTVTIFGEYNMIYKEDFIPFLLPLSMFLLGNHSLIVVLKMWLFIMLVASFTFSVIGLNAAHHHPDIVHDGDALRDGLDWGIYELDTVMDREDLKGSAILVLTHFGEHALHHLFPTIDHGILPQLNEIFLKTCEEFGTELSQCSWFHHIIGQHQQLARIETRKIPRFIEKKKTN